MWGNTDIVGRVPTPRVVSTQQEWQVRSDVPSKAGTFDCKKSNDVEIKADLLG